MSAFFISYKTLTSILLMMKNLTNEERTVYGKKLLELNRDALIVRYNDKPEKYRKLIDDYEYDENILEERHRTAQQSLRSLNCLIYQCSEANEIYDNTETKAYKDLIKLKDLWRSSIPEVSDEGHEWDIS